MVSIPFLKMLDRLIREAVSLEVFNVFITNKDMNGSRVVERSDKRTVDSSCVAR